jgi:Putative Actinobacterial Holin-X, holin superfamily III
MANDDTQLSERSVAELLRQASDQTVTLVRQELDLAKAELTIKGKQVGLGGGLFGGAGVFGMYAFGALTAAIILAVSLVMSGWLAGLIVAIAYGAIAGILALQGKRQVKAGTPPLPEQSVESVKADLQSTKQHLREGRR